MLASCADFSRILIYFSSFSIDLSVSSSIVITFLVSENAAGYPLPDLVLAYNLSGLSAQ
jgi:hypothetical protein